jgi:hypothetical protein
MKGHAFFRTNILLLSLCFLVKNSSLSGGLAVPLPHPLLLQAVAVPPEVMNGRANAKLRLVRNSRWRINNGEKEKSAA